MLQVRDGLLQHLACPRRQCVWSDQDPWLQQETAIGEGFDVKILRRSVSQANALFGVGRDIVVSDNSEVAGWFSLLNCGWHGSNMVGNPTGVKSGPSLIVSTYGDVRPEHLVRQAQRIRFRHETSEIS